MRSLAGLLKLLDGDRAVRRSVLTNPVPVVQSLFVRNDYDAFRAVSLRVIVWSDIVNASLSAANVCEGDASGNPAARDDHDLVLHINTLIGVNVLRFDDPAVAYEDKRRGGRSCDGCGQQVIAEVECLSANLHARVRRIKP